MKKIVSLCLCVCMLLSLGLVSHAEGFTPGSYEAAAHGFGGDVTVKITAHNKTFTGRGLSTDIIEASVNAYLTAMNRMSAYEAKAKEDA